jgi:hypothetical protein
MICIKCQKEIPENSVFCMFCGYKQTEPSQENIPLNPPVYISGVDIRCTGPKKEERGNEGLFGTTYIGRWIEINFNLRDERNDYTASDGTLLLALAKSDNYIGNRNLEKYIEALRKGAFYFLEQQIHADDFKWHGYSNAFGKKWKELNVTLLINKFVYAPESYSDITRHHIHCLFKPANNQWLTWNPSEEYGQRLEWK